MTPVKVLFGCVFGAIALAIALTLKEGFSLSTGTMWGGVAVFIITPLILSKFTKEVFIWAGAFLLGWLVYFVGFGLQFV